jgi:hypothetical protein
LFVAHYDDIDYLKCAYALALSIKTTQKPGYDRVALVIDNKESLAKLSSPWVFDTVIEWDQEKYWDGRSWMDQLSPFDHTVCLDADMLFLRDYSHWIDYFIANSELYVANQVYTYRGETITDRTYRKTFDRNCLPDLYSMWTFFSKGSVLCQEFFELGRQIIKNPREFANQFLSEHRPKVIGTDEAFALAANILDITDDIAYDLPFPRVVHMKPMLQKWPWPADTWSDHVGFYLNADARLKIGNFQQNDIVHYVEKNLITNECIHILETKAWKL